MGDRALLISSSGIIGSTTNGLNPALVGTFKNSEKEIVIEML